MQRTSCMLNLDPGFRRLVLPLTQEEQKALEDELYSPGKLQKIRVWYNTILTEYTLYEYCQLMELPFETVRVSCASRDEAIVWICTNQIERSGLTKEMRRYLIGKRSLTETALGAREYAALCRGNSGQTHDIEGNSGFERSQTRTREKISRLYGLGASTVRKYELYTYALDRFSETVPDFVESHLAGRIRLSLDRAIAMTDLNKQELREEWERILEEAQLQTPAPWRRRLLKESPDCKSSEKKTVTIKDMPAYDPDAEISSLALTIPSWISTISRVYAVTDIQTTTIPARSRLRDALKQLKRTANTMLRKVQEG